MDTTRFRKELSQRLAIDPRNVHGYIIGEHGDSEVAVWSHTMIGTKPILEIVDTTERLTSDDLPIISDKVKIQLMKLSIANKRPIMGLV